MTRSLSRASVALAAACLLVLAVACDEKSTAEKHTTACDELAQLETAVTKLDSLGPSSTVGELKDARNEVKKQADEARRAIRDLNESKAVDLASAVDDLSRAVNNISSDESIASARASIQDELLTVRAAREHLTAELNCQ